MHDRTPAKKRPPQGCLDKSVANWPISGPTRCRHTCTGKRYSAGAPARSWTGRLQACVAVVALSVLPACDPQVFADKTTRQIAEQVVFPVVNVDMPAGPAKAATNCILDAASVEEHRLLARDVGVEAGSLTKATIRDIALRPAAQSCFAANGVPPIR